MAELTRREFAIAVSCAASVARLHSEASGKTFVAFSMNRAREALREAPGAGVDFRRESPSLYRLGAITKPWAVVIDDQRGDWILVGERDRRSAVLSLDDWVVALRSRFVHGPGDPGVTIDPRVDGVWSGKQDVRFFGGIEDTRFGRVCYEADWLMKKIGLKTEALPVAGLRPFFDLAIEEARRGGGSEVSSRFWFYPTLNRVNVFDGVVLLERFQMGVFTEIMSARVNGREVENPSDFHFGPAQGFARSFEANYDAIAESREVFETLRGLTRLAGLAAGLVSETPNAHLDYWLAEYPVEAQETPREVDVLRQTAPEVGLSVSGGVSLGALALRLAEGDAGALRELVLAAREGDPLVWEFEIGMVDGRPAGVRFVDRLADPAMIIPLWTQAVFLFEKEHYEAAASLLGNIIELLPDWEHAYCARGAALSAEGDHGKALQDFDRALSLNPRFAEAHFGRAQTLQEMRRFDEAAEGYTRALSVNPNMIEALVNRGMIAAEQGQFDKALADYGQALKINPRFAPAYLSRAIVLAERAKLEEALADIERALESAPHLARAYLAQAVILEEMGRPRQAVEAYSQFLKYDHPRRDSAQDWKAFAESRATELLKEIALPPAYEQSHGGVPMSERLRRIRAKLDLTPKELRR